MHASPSLPRRITAIVAALAAAIAAGDAAAQAPPDLPPLQPPAPAPPSAQPASPAQPAPMTPAPRMAPPGFNWTSPSEIPPGFAMPPGYYPMPYYGRPTPRPDDYALPPPPPRRRYNTGMWVGGVIMVGAGIATAILGAGLVSSASDRVDIYCDSPSFPCAHKDDDGMKTLGAILMAGGAIMGAAGIPMWLVGSRFVPVTKGAPGDPAPARPALSPEVRIGPGVASFSLRF